MVRPNSSSHRKLKDAFATVDASSFAHLNSVQMVDAIVKQVIEIINEKHLKKSLRPYIADVTVVRSFVIAEVTNNFSSVAGQSTL